IDVLIPAIIVGIARGSSILVNLLNEDIPIPVAASVKAGFTSLIPVYVLRKMGNNTYNTTATTAGMFPLPNNGIRNASTARSGMGGMVAGGTILRSLTVL